MGEGPRSLENEIIGSVRKPRTEVTGDIKPPLVRVCESQTVRHIGKGDDTVEFVIAVGSAAKHMQRQIDLGWRPLAMKQQ